MTTFHQPALSASLLKPNDTHDNETILKAMENLRYPVYCTLKKDGIRCIRLKDLFSRRLKLIPNVSIRRRSMKLPFGFDCELWNPSLPYDRIESIVMSAEHPDSDLIQFHVLDIFDEQSMYLARSFKIQNILSTVQWDDVKYEVPVLCKDAQTLMDKFIMYEQLEGEGICFRLGNSPYKQGYSTLKEQYLVKLARYITSELVIIGFKEQMHNCNKPKRNALGYIKRSTAQHKLIGKGTLGAFICRDPLTGIEVDVGSGVGLTDLKRQEIYDNQEQWLGKTITVKHKPIGAKIKPRHPVLVEFKGIRNTIDL